MAVGRIGEYRLGTNASWDEYVERLEMFCEANKIAKEEQKRAVLLSCCGEEAYGLTVILVKPSRPRAATYEEIKTAVHKHLHPRPSELYARFLFYKRNQAAEESVADYVTALRKLAEDYGFSDEQLPLDIMIRDRFVCGLQNEAVQQLLLAEHDLTFNVAYDMAATAEATAKQQRDIRMQGQDETKDCQGMIQPTRTKKDATVFRRDLPGFNGPPIHIELKDDAQPVFLKSRPVPLALKDDVGKEVDRLVQQGNAQLRVNKDKCESNKPSIEFLGHKIDATGIHPSRSKTDAIHKAPAPTSKKELQAFLGLLNFYRSFLKGKTEVAEPLYRLLDDDHEWKWTVEERLDEARSRSSRKCRLPLQAASYSQTTTTAAGQLGSSRRGKSGPSYPRPGRAAKINTR
ncbi:uncharacterized protein [Dermacentor andersoni]|uniref:uncharacterized protein n=1 Tax=Dermacentor andersoni TaxID=34620 RepID=UPI003B3B824B